MPRIQINQKQKKQPKKLTETKYIKSIPKNIKEIKYLIKIILPYSAKNKRANPPLPYSILKPETNSDSPSAKSKGVRLVSASLDLTQHKNNGKKTIKLIIKI